MKLRFQTILSLAASTALLINCEHTAANQLVAYNGTVRKASSTSPLMWYVGGSAKLEQIVRFIHSQGARAGMQLAHAGRKGSMTAPFSGERLLTPEEGRWEPEGPSAIAFSSSSCCAAVLPGGPFADCALCKSFAACE